MASYRVVCIVKPGPNDSALEHIQYVHAGQELMSVEKVISLISRGDAFYVLDFLGNKAYVQIVNPGGGRKPFIKTIPDSIHGDNLLSLPECSHRR